MILKLFFSIFLFASLQIAFAATEDPNHSPNNKSGDYDTFNLSMTYHNDYCAQHSRDMECTTQPIFQGLSLHGLWPDRRDDPKNKYGYCDLPADKVKIWCDPAIDVKSKIPADEFSQLLSVQPGDVSCLYNHEWYAHGSCTNRSVADYFMDSLSIAQRFLKLPNLQQVVKNSAGKTVDLVVFQNALLQDLGPKADDFSIVLCRKDQKTGSFYFSSLLVGLDKVNYMKFPEPSSFAPLKPRADADGKPQPNRGNCPATGIQVSP